MLKYEKTWTDFKALVDVGLRFVENGAAGSYELYAEDGGLTYLCRPLGADETDYTTNYQSKKVDILHPIDEYGKRPNRASSRPPDKTTYFTTRGDDSTTIRAGNKLIYDFANTDHDVTPPTGFKRKEIDITFLNATNIKEGAIYYKNMEWGSYVDL